jgi:hypothetical protein
MQMQPLESPTRFSVHGQLSAVEILSNDGLEFIGLNRCVFRRLGQRMWVTQSRLNSRSSMHLNGTGGSPLADSLSSGTPWRTRRLFNSMIHVLQSPFRKIHAGRSLTGGACSAQSNLVISRT